jgi:uncharacterized OB-fold protein
MKPLPTASLESRPFWEATRQHRLAFPRCDQCRKFWFPPSGLCPHCLSDQFQWEQVSGRGIIHSFVVFHRVYDERWASSVPYTVAVIKLEEGPRMISNIVGSEPTKLRCGMRVAVRFEDASAEYSVPTFFLAD